MPKTWRVSLACPRAQEEDSKVMTIIAKTEKGVLLKLNKYPEAAVHCPHGPLKVVELKELENAGMDISSSELQTQI
ncbi:MAG TPA: hypothetical protein ENI23_06300 [bacterium]|nr:hypothetical protein [bacterium]